MTEPTIVATQPNPYPTPSEPERFSDWLDASADLDDGPLLDQIQGLYERIWSGGECKGCKLRAVCPGPLDRLAPVVAAQVGPRPRARKAPKRRAKPSGSQG